MSPTVERIQILIQEHNDIPTHIFSKLGLPKNALSVWKTGKANPSVDALIKISDYYNVSIDYLVKGTDKQLYKLSQNELEWLNACKQISYNDQNFNELSQNELNSIINRILELIDKNDKELEWLELYKQLSLADEPIRNECIGFVKGYIKGSSQTKNR